MDNELILILLNKKIMEICFKTHKWAYKIVHFYRWGRGRKTKFRRRYTSLSPYQFYFYALHGEFDDFTVKIEITFKCYAVTAIKSFA